jgi:hypothetical protein
MKSRKKPVPKIAEPTTIVQNCTFTNHPASSETVQTIARALEANATALNALANQLIEHKPMLQIGGKD